MADGMDTPANLTAADRARIAQLERRIAQLEHRLGIHTADTLAGLDDADLLACTGELSVARARERVAELAAAEQAARTAAETAASRAAPFDTP